MILNYFRRSPALTTPDADGNPMYGVLAGMFGVMSTVPAGFYILFYLLAGTFDVFSWLVCMISIGFFWVLAGLGLFFVVAGLLVGRRKTSRRGILIFVCSVGGALLLMKGVPYMFPKNSGHAGF